MKARQQSWPRQWLMTDERMGERLWEALERLPRSSGIVFRHHSLDASEREALARRVAERTRTRGIALAVARDADLAERVGAALVHNPTGLIGPLPFSRSVHSMEEAEAARTERPALVFVSPIYPTRSHPGQEVLGPELASRIAHAAGAPAIALGGMNAERFRSLDGFHGWAGIDAWLAEEPCQAPTR